MANPAGPKEPCPFCKRPLVRHKVTEPPEEYYWAHPDDVDCFFTKAPEQHLEVLSEEDFPLWDNRPTKEIKE